MSEMTAAAGWSGRGRQLVVGGRERVAACRGGDQPRGGDYGDPAIGRHVFSPMKVW